MSPDRLRQRFPLIPECERGAGIGDRGLDLCFVAHDVGIAHQALDVTRGEPGDDVWVESGEGVAEGLSLLEDREPRESRLETLEAELFVEADVVGDGSAPFIVVVGDVEGIAGAPAASTLAVWAGEGG